MVMEPALLRYLSVRATCGSLGIVGVLFGPGDLEHDRDQQAFPESVGECSDQQSAFVVFVPERIQLISPIS
jgi:hypothetical protein